MDFLKQQVFQGLPLEFIVWQFVYIVSLFLLLVFVLNQLLYKPVLAVLDERGRRIDERRGASDDSDRAVDEKQAEIMERLARARTEAIAGVNAAKAEAESVRAGRVDEARAKVDARMAKATEELDGQRASAESQLTASAETLGREIVERLLHRGGR